MIELPDVSIDELQKLLPFMTREERAMFERWAANDTAPWRPLPGPQTLAYMSEADVIGYGGAAGGGKTDLGIGLALTQHHKALFIRQHQTELTGIYDRLGEILGRRDFRDMHGTWRIPGGPYGDRMFRFGSLANVGDETKEQGKEKDLLVLEEVANQREHQVRFVMGWVRSARGLRTRVLMTFNPPTNSEGRWVIPFYAPWIDKKHIVPADPGELRYYITLKGIDHEVTDNAKRVVIGGRLHTEFDARDFRPEDILAPQSRTFIPARVSDNPFLVGTGYMATLQALPEPLRSQMLYGDFTAGIKDSEWQVIPSAWVEAACERWQRRERKSRMDSVGVDVARGGDDNTVIARLHEDNWFDEPLVYPGQQTPDGYASAGLVIVALRDRAPVHVDVIGVGASTYDVLKLSQQTIGVNVAEGSTATDKSGRLYFANQRSQLWWQFREALDPHSNLGIALPPDKRLIGDLTAPTWELRGKTVYVESREDIIKRIGRSPDWGSAYLLAWVRTPRIEDVERRSIVPAGHAHDPYLALGADHHSTNRSYDPYA